jgi:hypothetical protein
LSQPRDMGSGWTRAFVSTQEKLEQDGGGCHAGDAAGVVGRRDLDEIGAEEIVALEIADQTLGFKRREAARPRVPVPGA